MPPDVTGPRHPQVAGSCWPFESLTDSFGWSALDRRSRVPPGRPEPPGAETSCVRYWVAAWTERIAGRRPRMSSIARATMRPIRTAEKAIWRIGACMSVRRRGVGLCFVIRDLRGGIFVRVTGRTRLVKTEHSFYTDEPPVNRLPDRSDPWHRPRTPNSTATPTSRSSTVRRHRTSWSSGPSRSG